jgi:hypothetical protein
LAVQAKDRDAKASFAEVAQQWRDLARQAKQLERDRGVLYRWELEVKQTYHGHCRIDANDQIGNERDESPR